MQQLRKQLIEARNAVSKTHRQQADKQAATHFSKTVKLMSFERYGCYFSVAGEFPTQSLIRLLLRSKKNVYMPVVGDTKRMTFKQFDENTDCEPNRYHIPEPTGSMPTLQASHLDCILMPLVGYDKSGNRIGMGGGFYDRALASTRDLSVPDRPFLLGVAYHCQQVKSINYRSWDVPIDAILTESSLDYF